MSWWRPKADEPKAPPAWPEGLMGRVAETYPHAGPSELSILRGGFESYLAAVRMWGADASVAMPSKSVDEVWHNAMLHSKFYERLCQSSVGWFVHHDPGPLPGMGRPWTPADADEELSGLARAWIGACAHEGLDWREGFMPSIFAADRLLAAPGGFMFATGPGSKIEAILERAAALESQTPSPAKRRGLRG